MTSIHLELMKNYSCFRTVIVNGIGSKAEDYRAPKPDIGRQKKDISKQLLRATAVTSLRIILIPGERLETGIDS